MEAILTTAVMLLSQVAPSLASTGIVSLLVKIAPALSTAGAVGSAIKLVGDLLSPTISLARDEIPVIQDLIETLRGNSATTSAQMDELDVLDAKADARLDAAIAKAEAEDKAADGA